MHFHVLFVAISGSRVDHHTARQRILNDNAFLDFSLFSA
ncbi:hypothetical protein GZL_06325 [Streptomyces sp. 769]|nr:hypothetical protein GZL_06325 [Streptomyces sp. 769]